MDNRKRKGGKRDIDPSSTVKRCLFGKPDTQEREAESERQEQETRTQMEEMKLEYNYDFVNDTPLHLSNARYTDWELVARTHNDLSVVSGTRPSNRTPTALESYSELESQSQNENEETSENSETDYRTSKSDNSKEQTPRKS